MKTKGYKGNSLLEYCIALHFKLNFEVIKLLVYNYFFCFFFFIKGYEKFGIAVNESAAVNFF